MVAPSRPLVVKCESTFGVALFHLMQMICSDRKAPSEIAERRSSCWFSVLLLLSFSLLTLTLTQQTEEEQQGRRRSLILRVSREVRF